MERRKVPVSCLNPIKIKNIYTGDDVVVPCGNCIACLNAKGERQTTLVELECLSNRYNYFVTLTFNEESIPRMISCRRGDIVEFYDNEGIFLFELPLTKSQHLDLQAKVKNNRIPYLDKTILQKFLKRFRYNIDRYYEKAKISYFAIGEYGPKSFRSHFHIILSFNEPKIAEDFGKILHKSWSFGRIDYSAARDKCASYVAKYVNCLSSVPSVLKDKSVRPFCCHSFNYGRKLFESAPKKILEDDPRRTIRKYFLINDKYRLIKIPLSHTTSIIPRCKAMFHRHDVLCVKSYTHYRRFKEYYKTEEPSEIAHALVVDFENIVSKHYDFYDRIIYDEIPKIYKPLLDEIDLTQDSEELLSMLKEKYSYHEIADTLFNMFYQIMSYGRKFDVIKRLYEGITDYQLVRKIKDFYKRLDYINLTESLELQQDYFKDTSNDKTDIDFFYYNTFDTIDYKYSDIYTKYQIEQYHQHYDYTKHKEQNDANGIFIY